MKNIIDRIIADPTAKDHLELLQARIDGGATADTVEQAVEQAIAALSPKERDRFLLLAESIMDQLPQVLQRHVETFRQQVLGAVEIGTAKRSVIVGADLHMRPCLAIVNAVQRHQASVQIMKSGQTADASSMLDLMSLAASKDTELVITARGRDAQAALDAICDLIGGDFA